MATAYQKVGNTLVPINSTVSPMVSLRPAGSAPTQSSGIDYASVASHAADLARQRDEALAAYNNLAARGHDMSTLQAARTIDVQATRLNALEAEIKRMKCLQGVSGLPVSTLGDREMNIGAGQVGGSWDQIVYLESETVVVEGDSVAGEDITFNFTAANLGQMYGNGLCAVTVITDGGILASSPSKARWQLFVNDRESNIEIPLQASVETADGYMQWTPISHLVKLSKDPSFRLKIVNDLGGVAGVDDTNVKFLVQLGQCAAGQCGV